MHVLYVNLLSPPPLFFILGTCVVFPFAFLKFVVKTTSLADFPIYVPAYCNHIYQCGFFILFFFKRILMNSFLCQFPCSRKKHSNMPMLFWFCIQQPIHRLLALNIAVQRLVTHPLICLPIQMTFFHCLLHICSFSLHGVILYRYNDLFLPVQ